MASSCLRLRLRPQPRPGPGQIDAKVEIMNEKLTTVATIMSSESYNYIIHVLLSATLFFAYRLRRIFCRCNNVNDNGNDNGNATMAIMHIIRTARATGVRLGSSTTTSASMSARRRLVTTCVTTCVGPGSGSSVCHPSMLVMASDCGG